jgi:hypothetical protein
MAMEAAEESPAAKAAEPYVAEASFPGDPFADPVGLEPQTCRIRVPANGESEALLESVKRVCGEHPGRVPLFVHLLLPEQEVVVRVKGLGVDPAPDLMTKVEALLGQGSILVEYA